MTYIYYELEYFDDRNPEECGRGPRGDSWWVLSYVDDAPEDDLERIKARKKNAEYYNLGFEFRIVKVERSVVE